MSIEETFGTLNLQSDDDFNIVLDASESASESRDTIIRLMVQMLEKLPGRIGKQLYFLGNSAKYDMDLLTQNAKGWWEQNSRRGSFVT